MIGWEDPQRVRGMRSDFLTMMMSLITIDKRQRLQCSMTSEFMLVQIMCWVNVDH